MALVIMFIYDVFILKETILANQIIGSILIVGGVFAIKMAEFFGFKMKWNENNEWIIYYWRINKCKLYKKCFLAEIIILKYNYHI